MNRSSFRVTRTAYPVLVGLALASYSSGAISAPGTDEQRGACTPDVFRLCSSEIPNVAHILECMNVKEDQPQSGLQGGLHPGKQRDKSALPDRA